MADQRYGQTSVRTYLLPDSGTPATVTPDAAWGAWVELSAGLAQKVWAVAVCLGTQSAGYSWNLQLGTGPAGSEVVRWTGSFAHLGLMYGGTCTVQPILFAFDVPASTRIAVRARGAAAALVYAWIQHVLDADL